VDELDYLIPLLAEIILEDNIMITQLEAFIKLLYSLLAIIILREMILLHRTHAKLGVISIINSSIEPLDT
jgi:hypothetical protein